MKTIIISLVLLMTAVLLSQCKQKEPYGPANDPGPIDVEYTHEEQVKRGEYLVGIMGCNDCHSPKVMTDQGPVPDVHRLLSGHPSDVQIAPVADKRILNDYALFNMSLTASIGPWGTSYAANLTPDDTGLGSWSFEQFEKAMKQGKSKGMDNGRMLLPPMPWQNFRNISDEDLSAIWAYLRAITPIKNVVPAPVPPNN